MAEGEDECVYGMSELELHRDKITKSHHVPKTERTQCQNTECGAIFGYQHLRRPHHCNRCGEIFCRPCLKYRRRLNVMAQPDPLGVLFKVCLNCLEERIVDIGCTKRSHTDLFQELRHQARQELRHKQCDAALQTHVGTIQPKFWKEQFTVDILKECLRLLNGFQRGFGTLEAMMTLTDIRKYVVPEWQKSPFWTLEGDMVTCRHCGGKLGHQKKKRNCRVCGISLCKLCSYKELLLYFEDGTRQGRNGTPKLSIIKVIGSPEREPKMSMMLYCCFDCRTEIIQRQIEDELWYSQKPKPPDIESEMVRVDSMFRKRTENINTKMDKIATLIDEYDLSKKPIVNEENNNANVSTDVFETTEDTSKENIDELKCLKESVGVELDSFWSLYDELKSVFSKCEKPEGKRLQLAYNYFKAKKDYYIETKSQLGDLSKQFTERQA